MDGTGLGLSLGLGLGLENVLRDWTQHKSLSYLALHSDGSPVKEVRRRRGLFSYVGFDLGGLL